MALAVGVGAEPSIPLRDHEQVAALLARHYIPVALSGAVDVDFREAVRLFQQDDILARVQEAYARLLPPGEKPEFVVQQEAPNRWAYVNKRNQPSVIQELWREVGEEGGAELLYHTSGRRFFGAFEALTHVRLTPLREGHTAYVVRVYAYPEARAVRFLARHLRLVERYFEEKSDELTGLIASICRRIAHDPVVAAAHGSPARTALP